MKNILIVFIIIFILSCDGSKVDLQEYSEITNIENTNLNIEYSLKCREYFSNMISEINAISPQDSIISLYEFEPDKTIMKKGKYKLRNEGVYLYLLILNNETKKEKNMSMLHHLGTDEFFPIYFFDDKIEIDLNTMIVLPFKDIDFPCGSIFYSDTLSDDKAGVWSTGIDPT